MAPKGQQVTMVTPKGSSSSKDTLILEERVRDSSTSIVLLIVVVKMFLTNYVFGYHSNLESKLATLSCYWQEGENTFLPQ
jgi:hypothetical protein